MGRYENETWGLWTWTPANGLGSRMAGIRRGKKVPRWHTISSEKDIRKYSRHGLADGHEAHT